MNRSSSRPFRSLHSDDQMDKDRQMFLDDDKLDRRRKRLRFSLPLMTSIGLAACVAMMVGLVARI